MEKVYGLPFMMSGDTSRVVLDGAWRVAIWFIGKCW